MTRGAPGCALGRPCPLRNKLLLSLSPPVPLNAFPPLALSFKAKSHDLGEPSGVFPQGSINGIGRRVLAASPVSGWGKRWTAVARTQRELTDRRHCQVQGREDLL